MLRQQADRCDDRRVAGRAAVLRVEGIGVHGEGRLRPVLCRSVHAGAEPNGDRVPPRSGCARLPEDRGAPAGPEGARGGRARPEVDLHLLHQGVSAGRRPWAGRHGRGRGRQPLPGLHGRDRRVVDGVRSPQGRGGGEGRGRPLPPHLWLGLLLRGDGGAVRAAGSDRARHQPRSGCSSPIPAPRPPRARSSSPAMPPVAPRSSPSAARFTVEPPAPSASPAARRASTRASDRCCRTCTTCSSPTAIAASGAPTSPPVPGAAST